MNDKIPLLNYAALSYAEDQGPEKLRAAILDQLQSGDANHETIEFLAKLFDPESTSKFKVKISLRKEGSQSQRQKHSETLDRLIEIYRSMRNTNNFVNHAAYETGLSEKTIRRYREKVISLAKYLDELDAEFAESIAQEKAERIANTKEEWIAKKRKPHGDTDII